MTPPENEILTIPEVAKLFHVTDRTINTWVRKRGMPSWKPPGSSRRLFRRSAVLAWSMSNDQEAA